MMHYIREKRVLFITTKNLDYIRNVQEMKLIAEHAKSCDVIGSNSKWYPVRLLIVWSKLLMTRLSHFDTVFIGFAPQLVLPFLRFRLKNINVVEDFFISLFDTLCCDRKKISPVNPAGRFLHLIDKFTLLSADAIICDTKTHGQYFIEEFHAPPEKIFTLYLQADAEVYHPMQAARPAHLQEKYIVLYFGSILPLQGIDIVLQAMDKLKNQKDLYFYCIGPIKDKRLRALQPVSDNIEYIDWLPQRRLACYIAQADLCLAGHFCASVEKAKRTIPGKAFIYQAMGKPMILGDNPANHELYDGNMKAAFVEMGNAGALADEILRIKQDDKKYGHSI